MTGLLLTVIALCSWSYLIWRFRKERRKNPKLPWNFKVSLFLGAVAATIATIAITAQSYGLALLSGITIPGAGYVFHFAQSPNTYSLLLVYLSPLLFVFPMNALIVDLGTHRKGIRWKIYAILLYLVLLFGPALILSVFS